MMMNPKVLIRQECGKCFGRGTYPAADGLPPPITCTECNGSGHIETWVSLEHLWQMMQAAEFAASREKKL